MTPEYFVYKLIAPRPTFAFDLSESEAAIMGEHAAYWQPLVEQGKVVAFGPVLDPGGHWGLAVVRADDESEVRALGDADPAVTSGMATFDVFPMPGAVVRQA
jgi:uncharacterized protein YciI